MPVSFTQAYREALAQAPDGVILIETITVDHSTFPAPIRLVKSDKDLVLGGDTYLGRQFKVSLPEVSANSNAGLQITITDIDLAITSGIDAVVATLEAMTVLYQVFMNTEVGPQAQFDVALEAKSISLSGRQLSLVASYPDLVNKKVPAQVYDTNTFRGLR